MTSNHLTPLDQKINHAFAGLVVRKDLVKTVKGNAIVPSYVLEYLLGQYCATIDEDSIEGGINTVKNILAKHYVHRNEAGLIRSTIREKGRHKIIDTVSVALNDNDDVYEASFANLGIKKVLIDAATVKKHPKLLVGGVWCIADIEYEHSEDKGVSPWVMGTLKPIQMSHFDYEHYVEARQQFSLDEWLDVLMQSIGFNPEHFSRRSKFMQLTRLIPFCERNYNLIELGPKGTGKSHIYSEFSPHGILISGGEVTVPKLFVNNSNGKIGLVGYWDTVAFDEFAGKQKRVDKSLVDIMKNYMANKSFSRGVETLGADASMVFVGNTEHSLSYMLKQSDLFDALPDKFYDSAFLDRLHAYIPGWEVDIIRGEMFSNGYGFVVDYLAEVLRHLRNRDFSDQYNAYFTLSSDISTRDRDAINKTFSGFMKILFPQGGATTAEIEEILQLAIEGRKRVKDQLFRIDSTYPAVDFSYTNQAGEKQTTTTQEEREHPEAYYSRSATPTHHAHQTTDDSVLLLNESNNTLNDDPASYSGVTLIEQKITVSEGQQGVSYQSLLGDYLSGVAKLTLTDRNLRSSQQGHQLMALFEVWVKQNLTAHTPIDSLTVELITQEDEFNATEQLTLLSQIQQAAQPLGIAFSWQFDATLTAMGMRIATDSGWNIILSKGLDIFQPYRSDNPFDVLSRVQGLRACWGFEVEFIQ